MTFLLLLIQSIFVKILKLLFMVFFIVTIVRFFTLTKNRLYRFVGSLSFIIATVLAFQFSPIQVPGYFGLIQPVLGIILLNVALSYFLDEKVYI